MYDGAVGCVACLAVLVPLLDDHKIYNTKAVGKRVASVTCELKDIILGIELSVEYFKSSKKRKLRETVYILCDCSQAIEITVKKLHFATQFEVFKRLAHLENALSELNVKIVLVWIPGHQGLN